MEASPTIDANYHALLPILKPDDIKDFGDRVAHSQYLGKMLPYFELKVKNDPVHFAEVFKARFSSGRIVLAIAPDGMFGTSKKDHRWTLTPEGDLLIQIMPGRFGYIFASSIDDIEKQLEVAGVPYLTDLNIRQSLPVVINTNFTLIL